MPACSASRSGARHGDAGRVPETLRLRGVRRIPMLFQHDPAEPVGIWLELREDARGLFARGRLIPEVARARELLALVERRRDRRAFDRLSHGAAAGSIRAAASASSTQIDLWEISIVTFPLLAGARVRAVKGTAASSRPSRPRGRAPSGQGMASSAP